MIQQAGDPNLAVQVGIVVNEILSSTLCELNRRPSRSAVDGREAALIEHPTGEHCKAILLRGTAA